MIRLVVFLCAFGVASVVAPLLALADTLVDVRFKNLGQDRSAVREFLLRDKKYQRAFDPSGQKARDQPGLYFSITEVWVGRHDLDGDGVNEVIISISWIGYCGSIGCPFIVLKREGTELHRVVEVTGTGFVVVDRPLKVHIPGPPNDPGCNYSMALVPPRHGGVKTFHAYHTGAFWNGLEFRSFCISRCCE